MRCGDCIHCRWDDDEVWCNIREDCITKDVLACEEFKKQTPYTCGVCLYNVKAEQKGDLDFCAAHDLYDFTHDERKACEDFRKGYEND